MELIVGKDDVEIATESFGMDENPAVVLAMGATASMLWWPDVLCEGLANAGFHVIRYDHRDTGRSTSYPPGEPPYTAEDLADDLISVMDGYELERAHVAGMSLGGYIAQMAAIRRAERIMSLILIGSEPLGWTGPKLPGIAPEFMQHFATVQSLDWADRSAITEFMLETARLSAGDGYPFDYERETRRIAAEIDRADDIRSAFNHGLLAVRDDWSDATALIRQPVLVLHGEQDPVLPLANGEALAKAVPQARLIALNGVGHELPEAAIAGMVAVMADFIRKGR